jgi:aspartate kinase
VVTSVAAVPAVTQVRVAEQEASRRVQMFSALAEEAVSLDVINVTPGEVYFIVRAAQVRETTGLLDRLGLRYTSTPGCAKLSIVGVGMRGTPGVMARIQKALWEAGVEVLHSTDSNITISVLVQEARVADGVAALHKEFGLG